MSAPHVIKLNGPWKVVTLDDKGVELTHERINIRSAEHWEQVGEPLWHDGVAKLQLTRQFNWPATDTPLIRLEIGGVAPDQLTLNDQSPGFSIQDGRMLADIDGLQPRGNRLLICYGRANLVAGKSPISGVCLKIGD